MKPVFVFLAGHACIRCDKVALALLEKGYDVHLISRREPIWAKYYTTFIKAGDMAQLLNAVDIYKDVGDIFYVHNEPNWFVTIAKERTNKPVVLDVHDSMLARWSPEEDEEIRKAGKVSARIITQERNNFQLADALVFPTWSFRDLVVKEFALSQPNMVLPSYLPRRMTCYDGKEWLGGLVYEGRVDLKSEINKDVVNHGFRYADYEELANQCHDINMDFHMYSRADKPFLDVYENIAYTHVPQEYNNLLNCLSRHDWGLVGNSFWTKEWEVALPNKLFEYIGAGIPPVVINSKESADFVQKYDVGMVVDSIQELAENWKQHTEYRKKMFRARKQFYMDDHIGELSDFCKELL